MKISKERVFRAYQRLFGKEGSRNEDQEIVWADLQGSNFYNTPTYTSQLELMQINEGKRGSFLEIKAKVEADLDQPKPKVIKNE